MWSLGWLFGSGWVLGESKEEEDGEERKRTISRREKEDRSSSWDSGLVPTDLSSTFFFFFNYVF